MHAELDPDRRRAIISRFQDRSPFWGVIGIQLVEVKKGWARVRVPFRDRLTNSNGVLHGGVLFAAADSATGAALISLAQKGQTVATIELKISYLQPVAGRDIFAEAEIIQKGSRTAVSEIWVRDASGNLVAKALGTYAIQIEK
jgi:acyl-CoA thioesterase